MSIVVAFVCGSRSMTKTFFRNSAEKVSAKATVVVVFATPPFRLIVENTFAMGTLLLLSQDRTWERRKIGPEASAAIGFGKSAKRTRQLATAWRDTLAISAISLTPTMSSSVMIILPCCELNSRYLCTIFTE